MAGETTLAGFLKDQVLGALSLGVWGLGFRALGLGCLNSRMVFLQEYMKLKIQGPLPLH